MILSIRLILMLSQSLLKLFEENDLELFFWIQRILGCELILFEVKGDPSIFGGCC